MSESRLNLSEVNYPRTDDGFYDIDRMGCINGQGFQLRAQGANIPGHGFLGGHWCPPNDLAAAVRAAQQVFVHRGVTAVQAADASQLYSRIGWFGHLMMGRAARKAARAWWAAEYAAQAKTQELSGFGCKILKHPF